MTFRMLQTMESIQSHLKYCRTVCSKRVLPRNGIGVKWWQTYYYHHFNHGKYNKCGQTTKMVEYRSVWPLIHSNTTFSEHSSHRHQTITKLRCPTSVWVPSTLYRLTVGELTHQSFFSMMSKMVMQTVIPTVNDITIAEAQRVQFKISEDKHTMLSLKPPLLQMRKNVTHSSKCIHIVYKM